MCREIMHAIPDAYHWISECFKKQGTCKKKTVEKGPLMLKYVPDYSKVRSFLRQKETVESCF